MDAMPLPPLIAKNALSGLLDRQHAKMYILKLMNKVARGSNNFKNNSNDYDFLMNGEKTWKRSIENSVDQTLI